MVSEYEIRKIVQDEIGKMLDIIKENEDELTKLNREFTTLLVKQEIDRLKEKSASKQ